MDEDDPARFMDIEMQSNPNPGSVYPSSDEEMAKNISEEEVLEKQNISEEEVQEEKNDCDMLIEAVNEKTDIVPELNEAEPLIEEEPEYIRPEQKQISASDQTSSQESSLSSESDYGQKQQKILSEQSEEEEYSLLQGEVHSQFIRDNVEFKECPFKEFETDLEHNPFKLAHKMRGGVQTPPHTHSLDIWKGLIGK